MSAAEEVEAVRQALESVHWHGMHPDSIARLAVAALAPIREVEVQAGRRKGARDALNAAADRWDGPPGGVARTPRTGADAADWLRRLAATHDDPPLTCDTCGRALPCRHCATDDKGGE